MLTIRMLVAADHDVLSQVAGDVFDGPVSTKFSWEFLSDPRHHLAVAITQEGSVVGMASAVHYVHPDKPPQMFINEVGVSQAYEGQGIGKRLLAALLRRAAELGCTEAWTATEPENLRAQALYTKVGGVKDSSPFVMYTFPIEGPSERSDD